MTILLHKNFVMFSSFHHPVSVQTKYGVLLTFLQKLIRFELLIKHRLHILSHLLRLAKQDLTYVHNSEQIQHVKLNPKIFLLPHF